MNIYLGMAVSLIYLYVSASFLFKGDVWMAIAYFGWASANAALLMK